MALDEKKYIVLTPGQLQEIIEAAIKGVRAELASSPMQDDRKARFRSILRDAEIQELTGSRSKIEPTLEKASTILILDFQERAKKATNT